MSVIPGFSGAGTGAKLAGSASSYPDRIQIRGCRIPMHRYGNPIQRCRMQIRGYRITIRGYRIPMHRYGNPIHRCRMQIRGYRIPIRRYRIPTRE